MAQYYVAPPPLGNNSNTGLSQVSGSNGPWAAPQWAPIVAGDTISFQRGGTYAPITVGKSGTSNSARITLNAWGSGALPIISGWTTISAGSWLTTSISGVYAVSVAGIPQYKANAVTLDGNFMPLGKLPRGNTGYYNITSSSGTNPNWTINGTTSFGGALQFQGSGAPNIAPGTITVNGVAGLDLRGGEVCYRPRHWVLWRGAVSSQNTSTGVISFSSDTTSPFNGTTTYGPTSDGETSAGLNNGKIKFGFFLQNHPALCTQLGDWAYDPVNGRLFMFFGASGPAGHTVQIATAGDAVAIGAHSFITLDSLNIQGAVNNLVNIVNSTNVTINACNLFGGGYYGVFANGSSSNLTLTNSTIDWASNNGVRFSSGSSTALLTGNTISNCGAIAGMGASGEGAYWGVQDIRNGTMQFNTLQNIGYTGISYLGTSSIFNNFLNGYCICKDDGSGIYGGGSGTSGTVIDGNICLNGLGMPTGTPDTGDARAHGIYVDDGATNVIIRNNTCAFNGNSGLNNHASPNITYQNNTCFDNKQYAIKYYNGAPFGDNTSNIVFTNNIMFALTASENVLTSTGGTANTNTFFSTADNNKWCKPIAAGDLTSSTGFVTKEGTFTFNGSGTNWKNFTGKEASSSVTFKTIASTSEVLFLYNATNSATNPSLGVNSYVDVYGTPYSVSANIPAYRSLILLLTASGPPTQRPHSHGHVIG